MFSHDQMRTLYGRKTIFIPLASNVTATGAASPVLLNVPTTTTNVASFVVPQNCLLKRVDVSHLTADGATSALTAQVKRGTTVLASATTAAGTAAAVGVGAEVTVILNKGEQLIIAVLAVNATDDFTAPAVTVTFEPMHQDS